MEKKNKTEFSELRRIPGGPVWDPAPDFGHCTIPWPPWDPAPDFLNFLDKAKSKEFVRLQINFKMKELENQLELYREALKLI